MVRLLLIGLVILVLVSGGLFFLAQKNSLKKNIPASQSATTVQFASSSATLEDRFQSIQNAITMLDQKVSQSSSNQVAVDQRLSKLESEVATLQGQSNTTPTTAGTPAPTAASSNKSPLYIPLGWTGSATSQDFSSLTSQSIKLGGGDYPGYTSMQFEVSLRIYQGNGTAFAQLFNNDDSIAVLPSQVSTTAQDFTWVSSSGFTIPAAQKTYVLQLKTLTGYSADVQNARIKVNF